LHAKEFQPLSIQFFFQLSIYYFCKLFVCVELFDVVYCCQSMICRPTLVLLRVGTIWISLCNLQVWSDHVSYTGFYQTPFVVSFP